MEPRQSLILYVRTSDKVLLRFADLDTARAWLESRRLSLEDEFLASDETWQPLSRLFRVDLPPPGVGTAGSGAAFVVERERTAHPAQTPTVPFFPDALAPRGPQPDVHPDREGPTRLSSPAPSGKASPEPAREPIPATVSRSVPEGPRVRIRSIEPASPGPDLWGEEPDAPRIAARRRRRRALTWTVILGVVGIAGGAVAWFASHGSSSVQETTGDAQTSVPVAARATLAGPTQETGLATQAPVSGTLGTAPQAPPRQEPVTLPQGVQTGASDSMALVRTSSAPPTAPGPSIPPAPPLAPATVLPPQAVRPAPAPPASGSPAAPRADDLGYDQHMAEGMKWLSRDPKKAHAHFQAASLKRPGSVEPKAKMAECEYRLGHLREAAALYQQALDVNPEYGPAIVGLARTHDRMGNAKDARFWYSKYLDVNPNGSHAPEARAYLGR